VWINEVDAKKLLDIKPSANIDRIAQQRAVTKALTLYQTLEERVHEKCEDRATQLLADHRRVRQAAVDKGRYDVKPVLPPDLMGVYVLLPDVSEG
jgi:hypothetical protein